ncbi:MAG: transglutaminase family protein [Gammaproteobacteria bacterium]
MNIIKPSQHIFLALKRHVLFVVFICYLPHITTEPWWLFTVFLAAIGYRLLADYFCYPLIPRWIRFVLVIGCLFLLYGDIHATQFLIRFLLIFIILKCIEIHTIRDLKALVICNFFLIFSALIVVQELWMIIYLLIAILANLSIMLKLSAPQATLKQIASKTCQQLLIAIPLCIVLFYFFPRIDPLWQVRSLSKSSIGFSESMNLGSITELFNDDSTVMQISFKKNPIFDGYWRGITLSYYTGESWNSTLRNDSIFFPLPAIKGDEIADYEILLEPNQTKWLFYAGYPIASRPNLIFSYDHGLMQQNKEAVTQRYAYSLKVQSTPYQTLNPTEYAEATQLPNNVNPHLNAWAQRQFAKMNHDISAFINFLHNYIHQQSFWYTLRPPDMISNENLMDTFWFDTRKGFCEHYASAVTFILRSVGIPARVILGFQGGQWNPIAHTILIQRNDAHAWLEYWQDGVGWKQLDPTSFVATERIDQTILNRQMDLQNQLGYFNISELPLGKKFKLILESVRFFSEEWFLFYNQNTQLNLLQHVGLGQWNKGQLLQASVGFIILFFLLIELGYEWKQKRTQDSLVFEYHLLQKEFRRFNISTHASATLKQQCSSLINKSPGLHSILSSFIHRYEELRLKQSKENKKETIALLKTLRLTLRRCKPANL